MIFNQTGFTNNALEKLLKFLQELNEKKISFTLNYVREETIMILISVPGERWEVEFFIDGSVEVERFISREGVESGEAGEKLLMDLFERFSDLDS